MNTEVNHESGNHLVGKGLVTKQAEWNNGMMGFRTTNEGERAMRLSDMQIRKLTHAFGLDHSEKPYRNHEFSGQHEQTEWEDLCSKGYAVKEHRPDGIYYAGTLKGLQTVFHHTNAPSCFAILQKVRRIRQTPNK